MKHPIISLSALLIVTACAGNQPVADTNERTAQSSAQRTSSSVASSAPAVSIPGLRARTPDAGAFTVGAVLEKNSAYTRHYITYRSGTLTISGIMNVPAGPGPFPLLILNHGHIDTAVYTNGRGLKREQDYFARHGYVVVHPDYRNHAASDKDDRDQLAVRLSYIEDAVNAAVAARDARLPYIDGTRIGMLGHSMGGGVTLGSLVAEPGLVDAAVLYAPVTGSMRDSYERWMKSRPGVASSLSSLYGTLDEDPEFWSGVSSETYYADITAPVRIFQGTADKDVPPEWADRTLKKLQDAGVDASLTIYPGAPHEFVRDWTDFMEKSVEFYDEMLKSA